MKKSADLARGRAVGREWRRARANWLIALGLSLTAGYPAVAEEQVRIGLGFGLAFLPAYICEDLKLVEKHGKEGHIELRASYQQFLGTGALQEASRAGRSTLRPSARRLCSRPGRRQGARRGTSLPFPGSRNCHPCS
jgi:hypothetical protein